jgi:hypothetical protein
MVQLEFERCYIETVVRKDNIDGLSGMVEQLDFTAAASKALCAKCIKSSETLCRVDDKFISILVVDV